MSLKALALFWFNKAAVSRGFFMSYAFPSPCSLNSQRELDSWQISSAHSERKPQRKNEGKASQSGVPWAQWAAAPSPEPPADLPSVCRQETGNVQHVPSLSTQAKYRSFLSANSIAMLFHGNTSEREAEERLLPFNQFVNFIDHITG